jgi:hypothetical protein
LDIQSPEVEVTSPDDLNTVVSELAKNSSHVIAIDSEHYLPDSFWDSSYLLYQQGIRFSSVNVINGVVSNGGVRVIRTDSPDGVCTPATEVWSVHKTNVSAFAAWSVAFYAVLNGYRKEASQPNFDTEKLPQHQAANLIQWLTIGADVNDGTWSCLGAWDALFVSRVLSDTKPYTLEDTQRYWNQNYLPWANETNIFESTSLSNHLEYMQKFVTKENNCPIPIFSPRQSELAKFMLVHTLKPEVVDLMFNL